MTKTSTKKLTVIETLGSSIVSKIRSKELKNFSTISGAAEDEVFEGYEVVTENGTTITVKSTRKDEGKVARYTIDVTTSDNRNITITGLYARKAWQVLTKKPKVTTKTEVDIDLVNELLMNL